MEHLERSLSFYGQEDGLILFRKFAAGYLKPYELERETRRELLMELDAGKFKSLVGEFLRVSYQQTTQISERRT